MKTVYLFNDLTLEYTGSYDAQESPLEPGVFLTPAASTDVQPPVFSSEAHSCKFMGTAWVVAVLPSEAIVPEAQPDYPPVPKQLSSLLYLDLFTEAEQLQVVTATMQSAQVKLWYDKMLAAEYITLADARTEQGLDVLVELSLLTPERKAQIITEMQ